MENDIQKKEDILFLNKKIKRSKPDKEEKNIKEEIYNYLNFFHSAKNDIFKKSSEFNDYEIGRKIFSTTSKTNFDYICQEIKYKGNIQINDAKILLTNNLTFLFLISDSILYIYTIKEGCLYELIKSINFNADNRFIFSFLPKNIFFINYKAKTIKKTKDIKNDGKNNKNDTKIKIKI